MYSIPGVLVEADPDEVDNVGVVEFAHDERLHQEVHLSCSKNSIRICCKGTVA